MNALHKLFQHKKEILNIYFTAGFPNLDSTLPILKQLQSSGADIVEIGMPYSDPLADGKTIQLANTQALENGMSLDILFEQLADEHFDIPIVLMGYFNPIMQYGVEQFLHTCSDVGVSGLIIPDLPIDEYVSQYQESFQDKGIDLIFLITPHTSEERIRAIDGLGTSFIYMVSSSSITGAKKAIQDKQIAYFKRVQEMNLRTPRLIGFGIHSEEQFRQACDYADGAIIGSAFIETLKDSTNILQDVDKFVKNIKHANQGLIFP